MKYVYEEQMYNFLEEMAKTKELPQESIDQFYIVTLKNFIEFLTVNYNDTPISSITEHVVDRYLMEQKKKKKNATVTNRFAALNHYFDYLYSEGKAIDIFKTMKKEKYMKSKGKIIETPKIDTKVFDKLDKFIDDPSNNVKDRLILALIIRQGLSKGEIINLKRSTIDFDFAIMYTSTSNSGKKSEKFLLKSVAELLNEYINNEMIGLNEPLLGYRDTRNAEFNNQVGKICLITAGHKLSPTDLREYLRMKLLTENINSLNVVAKFFNENITTTEKTIKKFELYEDFPLDDCVRNLVK